MPPTKKVSSSSPVRTEKTLVTVLQENIRLKAKEVREPLKRRNTGPSTSSKDAAAKPGPASSKVAEGAESNPSSSKTVENLVEPAKKKQKKDHAPWDNPYAREIFFCKTNIREISRQVVMEQTNCTDPADIEAAAKNFRYKLFQGYVEKPHYRIREPLYKLKFESEYYEYRMHLALAKELCSEEDYQDYKEQLDASGLSECWVSMRKDNLLLVHEDKVLKTVRAKFQHWGSKLVKLTEYLMQSQRNYESKLQAAAAKNPRKPEIDPLLDALMNQSNAHERMNVKDVYAVLVAAPSRYVLQRSLRWLVFEDDSLNQRFGLGSYVDAIQDDDVEDDEMEENGITPLDVTSTDAEESIHSSEGSEIAQMRSEMAMTQPNEIRLIPSGGPFFQDTEEVITALEPTQPNESFAAVSMDTLAPPNDPTTTLVDPLISPEGHLDPQEDPLNVADPQDANEPGEPVPQQPEAAAIAVITFDAIPANHQPGDDGSELSLLTPGQQEVISISDDEDDHHSEAECSSKTLSDEIMLEDGFWANLDNVRRYTNVDEFIARNISFIFKNKPRKLEEKMDEFVKEFFEANLDTFRNNELPEGVVKLTQRARREREAASQPPILQKIATKASASEPFPPPVSAPQTASPKSLPVPTPLPLPVLAQTQSPPLAPSLEPLFNGALTSDSQFDTPRPPLPTKIRRIAYEDSSPPPARYCLDSMPMPDSENFLPEIHSTQNTFGGPMIGAAPSPGTPRPSPPQQQPTPTRNPPPQQRPSVDSRASTPGFACESFNETVLNKSPRKRSSPRVKVERNNSGYEGEVEEVPIDNAPIELEDTLSQSQIDPIVLIERCEFGVPLGMRNRMNDLFKNQSQQYDATLSQTPEKSGGVGRGGQRLSTDRQSMGFRNSQSPRVRSD